MAKTKIEWTEYSWNPVTGCTPVSEGCENCYARRMANRLKGRCGYPSDDPFRVTLHPERLNKPLSWQTPKRIFVNSMGDLFHEDVPIEFIAEVFNVMASATPECGKKHKHEPECWTGPSHTFLILTKRPERMRQIIEELPNYIGDRWPGDTALSLAMEVDGWPLKNVWLGVSVENQQRADERIPILLQIPAAVRFVSVEPMLGPVDLERWLPIEWSEVGETWIEAFPGKHCYDTRLHWVICGGETGPGARPMHPDWVRSLRDQCQASGIPFFFKSWGQWRVEHRQSEVVELNRLKSNQCVAKAKSGGHWKTRGKRG